MSEDRAGEDAPPPGVARSPSPRNRGEERRGRGWRKGGTFAFGAERMAAFVAAVEQGATVEAAAAAAGAAVSTVYHRRRTDAAFAEAWAGAAARSSGYADAAAALPAEATKVVWGHKGRALIRKRKRPVEFDRARRQAFLDHFAGCCNLEASAKAAGICVNSVYRALASDAAFNEGFEEALRIGYALLEAEALRQVREEQEAYKLSPRPDPDARALSFGRTMQLLREYHRGQGKIGRRPTDARLTKWSFEAAFTALEKRLRVFGLRIEAGEGPPGEHCD